MRICGDEAHIKIGLSDLFITAAPVLRMLAEKNIVYTNVDAGSHNAGVSSKRQRQVVDVPRHYQRASLYHERTARHPRRE